eukprot:jgi/Chrpa1/19830/Chrysochromulina_OHIO_Genome00005123-RA
MTKEELARVTDKEALGYTVWLVQPDGKLLARRTRLWPRVLGPGGRLQVVVAAAVGVHVDGLKPKGKRGPYGFSTPHTPPMSTQDRLGAARAPSRPSHSGGPTALVAFVQAHEVVMMHEAKPQVAAGKNAQIDVRVAKLREEWIANESIILNCISSHDMSSPRDAMIGEANAQRRGLDLPGCRRVTAPLTMGDTQPDEPSPAPAALPSTQCDDDGLDGGTEDDEVSPESGAPKPAWGQLRAASGDALVLEMDGGPYTLGRAESCTLRLTDNKVSGVHARLSHDGANAILEDLSSNGTFVNGTKMLLMQQQMRRAQRTPCAQCRHPTETHLMSPLRTRRPPVLTTSALGNGFERDVLTTYLSGKGKGIADLYIECLARAEAGTMIVRDIVGMVPGVAVSDLDGPTCHRCFEQIFDALVFQYRAELPAADLPDAVTRRSDCWHGIGCRTQIHNRQHAERLNHICQPLPPADGRGGGGGGGRSGGSRGGSGRGGGGAAAPAAAAGGGAADV